MNANPPELTPYLTQLRALLPMRRLRVELEPRAPREARQPDADFVVELPGHTERLHVEVKRTHLDRATAHALLGAMGPGARGWILLAPYIAGPLGATFRAAGLNYLDQHGNCHLRLGDRYVVQVEGRRANPDSLRPKGVRAAGIRALFALLARADLVERPLREIARQAGTNHQTALEAVRRLIRAGALGEDTRRRTWLPGGRRTAFDTWIADYGTVLRPTLHVGRFRTADRTPDDLDRRLAAEGGLGAHVWYGGTAAGDRLWPHYRGAETTLHVRDTAPGVVARRLRAIADPRGPLIVLGLPGPLALPGRTPDTVHPLLVHAEMLQANDERAIEAAALVKAHALPEFA